MAETCGMRSGEGYCPKEATNELWSIASDPDLSLFVCDDHLDAALADGEWSWPDC
jgi:hypothetical protein